MENLSEITSYPGGILGLIAGGIVGATMFIRKYWLNDKVDSANSEGHVGLIDNLNALLDKASARAEIAEKRAEEKTTKFYAAMDEISKLRTEVLNLNATIEGLKRRFDSIEGAPRNDGS